MALARTAGICLSIVLSSAIATGQQTSETVGETGLTEHTARRISPEVVRHDSTYLVRDVNGRWQAVEIRHREVREIGPSEREEEETIQRPDLNGKLVTTETNVIRSTANGDQVVIERYVPYPDGRPRDDGRPPLSERVLRTTTATADGGHYTVEEVEARSRVSPSDPMRVIRRTVTTVRRIGTDRWVTEQQVFERDLNGRLQLVWND